MKTRAKILNFILIIVILTTLTGCSKKTDNTEIAKNKESSNILKIGFIVSEFNDTESLDALNTIDNFAETHNIEIIETASKTNKSLLENMDLIAGKGGKGIIISAPDPKLGSAIVSRAKRLDVKVLSIRNRFINLDNTYIQKVPYLGISLKETSKLITETILDILKVNDWDITETAVFLFNKNEYSSYQSCILLAKNSLNKNGFLEDNVITDTPIPSPDGPIFSVSNFEKTQTNKFKNVIIYSFKLKNITKSLAALEAKYKYSKKNIVGFAADYTTDFKKRNLPSNYYGSIYINPREYGYKATKLVYNWVINKKEPPLNSIIKTKFVKNPNYK